MDAAERCAKLLARKDLDFWDVREDDVKTTQMRAWNSSLKDCSIGYRKAIAIRVLSCGAMGFSSTDAMDPQSVSRAVTHALDMAHSLKEHLRERKTIYRSKAITANVKTPQRINPLDISIDEKKKLLLDQTQIAPGIESQQYQYTEQIKQSAYRNCDGSDIQQRLTYTHLSASITLKGERVETFDTRSAGLAGFEQTRAFPSISGEALEGAKLLLRATTIKGGTMRVVTDPALTDVFVHEAVGHAAEADIVLQKDSFLEGKIGTRVAPDHVTIIDSGRSHHWGSFPYDDEGIPSQRTEIVKRGIVNSYLHSRETAAHFGAKPTGNGRAQDARHIPQVRMRWTYLEPGTASQEELIESARRGVYLCGSKGGQVNTSKGSFQFSSQYGFAIRNGKLAEPVREVALGGIATDILRSIEGISKDMPKMFPGYCGKGGQAVPVGGPCPSLLIGKALVGGKS